MKPIDADYIYHKNEKGKPPKTDLPLLNNDITNNLGPQKPVIYRSRYVRLAYNISDSNDIYSTEA
jgi:hypothetical protein